MKTQKFLIPASTLLLVLAFSFSSCRKHQVMKEDEDTDTTEAADQSVAENISNDIINIGSQTTDNSSMSAYKGMADEESLGYCATIKRDTTNHIDSVIFNNSTCVDGRVRNGILIFNYSGSTNGAKHYRDPGFKCTVTSSGYTVDDRSVNIIYKTIENISPSEFSTANVNLKWKITGHIQITKPNVGTHDVSYTRYKTLLNTSDPNVYHGSAIPISWNLARVGITGDASGTTAKGKTFTCNVTNQLIRDFGGCTIGKKHPFIQGTFEFTPGTRATRTVDFGQGTCDLDATVTIKGKTFNITLQ